jgi:hypothetical protein
MTPRTRKRSKTQPSKGMKDALRQVLVALLAGVLTDLIHDCVKADHVTRTPQAVTFVGTTHAIPLVSRASASTGSGAEPPLNIAAGLLGRSAA